jgi:hypothetical protein
LEANSEHLTIREIEMFVDDALERDRRVHVSLCKGCAEAVVSYQLVSERIRPIGSSRPKYFFTSV